MVLYKNIGYFSKSESSEFDTTRSPGTSAPHSGIYRCEGCGSEIAANLGDPLPPQNREQHDPNRHGTIRWRLIAWC